MESSSERVLLWDFQVSADSGGPMEAWALLPAPFLPHRCSGIQMVGYPSSQTGPVISRGLLACFPPHLQPGRRPPAC